MKRNFKRTLSLILAVLMVVAVVPFSGMAAECDHDFSGTVIVGEGEHARLCTKCKTVLGYKDAEGNDVVGYQACYSNKVESGCGSRTCDVCKQTFAGGHNFNQKFETEETRVKEAVNCDAYVRYYKSCTCSAVSNKAEDIFVSTTNKGTIHDFTARIMEPEYVAKEKCGEDLYYYFACSRCKISAEGFEVNPNTYADEETTVQHNFVIPTTPSQNAIKSKATCTSPAVLYMECDREGCGATAKGIDETKTYTLGQKLDHEFVTFDGVDFKGLTEAQREAFMKKFEINPVTCSVRALYTKFCKNCEAPEVVGFGEEGFNPDSTNKDIIADKYDEDGKKIVNGNAFYYGVELNHGKQKITKEEKAATCTTDGNTAEWTCEYCKQVIVESEARPKLGHDLVNGTLVQEYTAPTCVKNGQLGKVKCARCSAIVEVNAKGEYETTKENIASFNVLKLDHINNEGDDSICDRCGAILEASDTCTCICHGEGFMYFIGWILKWFWSLTGTNPYCKCGIAHYAVD